VSANRQILIDAIPNGHLAREHFRAVDGHMPQPGPGEALCRTILLSIDPANRAWMRMRTYRDQLEAGEVMAGFTLSEVVDPNGSDLAPGAIVYSEAGWQEYAALPAETLLPTPDWRPLSNVMSVFGITGLTAYFGLLDIGRPHAGETVLVSAAAGAVGSVAGQIAKIKGCRVVGIAGSDEKTRLLTEELGFDAAINRRSDSVDDDIRTACPDGVDLYFDNAAGPLLELVLMQLKEHGRVVCCGAAGLYDADVMSAPGNIPGILTANRLRMEGFVVLDYVARFAEAHAQLGEWIESGKIKVLEDVADGLEAAPDALVGLLAGKNVGKRLVRIASDPA
jgi:NADPH-dependent curcumin reductase CurA